MSFISTSSISVSETIMISRSEWEGGSVETVLRHRQRSLASHLRDTVTGGHITFRPEAHPTLGWTIAGDAIDSGIPGRISFEVVFHFEVR